MIESLYPYLPVDRRHALFTNKALPDRVRGAALFADISGFTPLTAALAQELGRQRGAEKVLDYINPIYEAIISELHRYRGSVIGFAGDSITCWIDEKDEGGSKTGFIPYPSALRAVACALRMQEIMAQSGAITTPGGAQVILSIKIAVAAGDARRFLAGSPQQHNFEALAGATLERMAAAEHHAEKGQVVVSQEVADALGDALSISEWRYEEESGRPPSAALPSLLSRAGRASFAVVGRLNAAVEHDPWPALPPGALSAEQLRPWIDEPVYNRLMSGALYLAELRPASSIFLRFSGIDYDDDDAAGEKLDAYIRWVQSILARYEGFMLQLTIGDKGSNLLAVFGAPVAHDDDEARAVAAALDLRTAPPELGFLAPPQVGVSQGLVWAGACGGRIRCIYTVMGDEVNMAARLMGKAAPGQVMVNQHVADATARRYQYNSLGKIQVKGRAEPLPVSEAVGRCTDVGATGQLAALFVSPLVGRESYLEEMRRQLAAAQGGQGQVLRLEGVAGVGKSHLAAVFVEQAAERGWRVALGACQSITQGMAYAPWRQLMAGMLELSEVSPAEQIEQVSVALAQVNPEWKLRLPLLGDVLGLPIPDNETTAGLEPRLRQQAMFALVAEIIQAWAKRQPLLLMIEDVHWLDEASAALTVAVARAIGHAAAALLVVQRPPLQADQPILPELNHLAYHHYLQLGDLSREGVAALVSNRLQGPLAPLVSALVYAQAQGNPFFTEELVDALREAAYLQPDKDGSWALSEAALNALIDGNCVVKVDGVWQMVENPPLSSVKLDIPDSVHGTVLARMDRLPEAHKLTLKVASVIGRTFGLALLQAAHPACPEAAALQQQIEDMGQRDFVRLEAPAPEPVYIFKHNTTQEVAYSTLLFAQRQELHAQVAQWHERAYGGDVPLDQLTLESSLAAYYPILVHHWHNAENNERECAYAGLAGEQAGLKFANEGAVRYFGRALDLTPEDALEARYKLLLGREAANDILAHRETQAQDLAALAEITTALGDAQKRAATSLRQAHYAHELNDYPAALAAIEQTIAQAVQAGDTAIETTACQTWGWVLQSQGHYQAARDKLEKALNLARTTHNTLEEARSLANIASVCRMQADYQTSQTCYLQAYKLFDAINHQRGRIDCFFMLGAIHNQLGDYIKAQANYEQALALCRAIGWRHRETIISNNLGNSYFNLGDYSKAQAYLEQARQACQEIGNRMIEGFACDTLSLVYAIFGDKDMAQSYARQAIAILQDIGDQRSAAYGLSHLGWIMMGSNDHDAAQDFYSQALQARRKLGQEMLAMDDLAGLARVALAQGNVTEARARVEEILAWLTANSPDGIEFPVMVYLICYQVLQAAAGNDMEALARARAVLQEGYKLLQERANRIQDEALRRQFLEKVPFNRDLLAA